MDDGAKATVKEIVKHLGGKYTIHMTRQNTHLVVERAAGQKFFAAPAYGVVAVTPEWLLASADAGALLCMVTRPLRRLCEGCIVTQHDSGCAGKLLPEADFYPPPPPLGAGGGVIDEGLASVPSQGLGPTQLPISGRPAPRVPQVGIWLKCIVGSSSCIFLCDRLLPLCMIGRCPIGLQ